MLMRWRCRFKKKNYSNVITDELHMYVHYAVTEFRFLFYRIERRHLICFNLFLQSH